ncbi:MAG: hypothetical protein M3R34_02295 [Acidobacteriota bacterium]|nr:hypothetical protein [Acidobacteriota bacterium]
MTHPFVWMAVAIVASPALAWLVYRIAKGLGFLEPPADRQHELRRTIVVAVYAFLLFLPVLFYGFEKGWPRAWVIFGGMVGLALLFFAGSGVWSARELWKVRHPASVPPAFEGFSAEPENAALAASAIGGESSEEPRLSDPPVRS